MATNNELNEKSVGIQSLASSGTVNGVSITATANQTSVSNNDGTAGNPTIGLTSTIYVTGISFDSGSNTLSAYASGTFSPTITGSTGAPVVTYAANGQIGNYEKLGLKVIFNAWLTLATTSGGTGVIRLDSLPFTSSSATNSNAEGPLIIQNTTLSASSYYTFRVSVNSTFGNVIRDNSAGSGTSLAYSTVTNTSSFYYSGSYNI